MIILKNANVMSFYPPSVENNMDVVIDENEILASGRNISGDYPEGRIIHCDGKYVSPGLVCSHNHFYSVLARGILADIKPPKDFTGILKNLWWRLDRALDEESLYSSGIVGALEAIKCGTTSVIDHNASPSFIKGSLSVLKECFLETGLRGILCYEATDRNGKDKASEAIEESVDFIRQLCGKPGEESKRLVEGAIGAHAQFTLSDGTLKLLSEAVSETRKGLHIHAAEDKYDSSYSHHFYGLDIAERLEKFGLLNEKSIIAHGIYLSESEIDILNRHRSFLVHNPRSNMNNSVGYSDKLRLADNLALGTDGIGSDMLEELKTGFYKSSDAKGNISLDSLLKALQNGNLILQNYFNRSFGKIEKGFTADIVVFNYNPPTPIVSENLGGHLAFGFSSANVETVIINGNIVLEKGEFRFDISPFYERARIQAEKLWRKIRSIRN
ncbi:MAG TPA: putative aminohydrolase SsnA [Ignavibacteriales bacterium]|nr:putative aminohydrolase SsnA [Ignavibacteriales bacterium]